MIYNCTTSKESSRLTFNVFVSSLALIACSSSLHASDAGVSSKQSIDDKKESPWLLSPTFSSDPKLGTSVGALAAYLHTFDSDSPASMFGISGSYSSTDSLVGALFARTYFDQGSQRLIAIAAGGKINNDYSDFLGTGLPASTTDDLNIYALRYLHQVQGDWFAGVQASNSNYTLTGDDDFSQHILDKVGLVGFDSIGVGIAIQYDSRDNQNSPSKGHSLEINNLAYRESFGGESSFDTYNLHLKSFFEHGGKHVLATNISGRWTSDAPASGYSSVSLRGYTRGQYLAPHMTSIEVEERYNLYKRWTLSAFAGVACLYGGDASCGDSSDLYPAAGIGARYMLKPEEKMVISTDLAYGKSGNNGFYIQFGQAF